MYVQFAMLPRMLMPRLTLDIRVECGKHAAAVFCLGWILFGIANSMYVRMYNYLAVSIKNIDVHMYGITHDLTAHGSSQPAVLELA